MSKTAIIGISCLFPEANSPEKYYENLLQNKDCTSLMQENQLFEDPKKYFHPQKGQVDKYYNMRGGFIHDFKLDTTDFAVDCDYLEQLDDIHQWSLYVAREALRDSGYLEQVDVLNRCGVVLGNLSFPTKTSNQLCIPIYHNAIQKQLNAKVPDPGISFHNKTPDQVHLDNLRIGGYPAMLIQQALRLSNIAFSIDSACATSLYSIKLAIDYLEAGKADMMLAGAVSAADPFFISTGFSIFQAYSDKDLSCPLDKRSGGLTSGEGAGMVLLKRYAAAVRDNDQIYAVIEGVGLSNDGSGKFILVPSSEGQVLALNRAYEMSGVKTSEVSYIECHATGTPVGDKAEMQTLDTVFQESPEPPLVGSVKSSIGHLLTAAGMASLIKIILSMNKGTIPATIHVKEPIASPGNIINSDKVIAENRTFPEGENKYAAINAFGFGGTNAHLILGAAVKQTSLKLENNQLTPPNQRLAIIGMSAYFGGEQDLNQLNYNIFNGLLGDYQQPGKRWFDFGSDTKKGLYYNSIEMDFRYFKIPPFEISTLLPQQMLVLKTADAALKDADAEKGINAGVIIAMEPDLSLHQFRGRIEVSQRLEAFLNQQNISLSSEEKSNLENQLKDFIHKPVEINEFTSFIGNTMASRISALWDFNGPAFTVSEEEYSFFRALEIAQMFLARKEVDMMVVGAVDMTGNIEDVYFHKLLLDKLKQSASLNIEQLPVSEGVAVLVLKRSEDITQNKQKTYAHLDAICINKTNGDVSNRIKNDLESSQINSNQIDYLEISGLVTGNKKYIEDFSRVYNQNSQTCIGRTNDHFGRLSCSSGAASMLKAVLAIYHRYLPGWSKKPTNDFIEDIKTAGFLVLDQSKTWNLSKGQTKRRASICNINHHQSSTHLLLSEHESAQVVQPDYIETAPEKMFMVKAQTIDQLRQSLEQFNSKLSQSISFQQLSAQHLAEYNTHQKGQIYTAVFIASNLTNLEKDIQSLLTQLPALQNQPKEWISSSGSYFTANPMGRSSKIAYLYPGIQSNYAGMWKDIFQVFPEVYHLFETYQLNPLEVLDIKETEIRKPINQIRQSAMAAILNTYIVKDVLKIKTDAAVGYGLGYNNLMFSLGYWQDLQNYFGYIERLGLFKNKSWNEMNFLENVSDNDIQKLNKCFNQTIRLNDFNKHLSLYPVNPLDVNSDPEKHAANISSMLCQNYSFSEQLQNIRQQGVSTFIEIGPNCLMKTAVDQLKNHQPCLSLSMDQPKLNVLENSFRLCAQLLSHGHDVDLSFLDQFVNHHQNTTKTKYKIAIGSYKPKLEMDGMQKKNHVLPPERQNLQDKKIFLGKSKSKDLTSNKINKVEETESADNHQIDIDAFYEYRNQLSRMQSQFLQSRQEGLNIIKAHISRQITGAYPPSKKDTFQELPEVESLSPLSKPIKDAIWSESDLMEFAEGKIANIFGEEYAIIDSYPCRVRLPMPPYFLVTRVTAIEAEIHHFKPSTIVTEYDVPDNSWYSVDGQIPWAVAVESGQCDLLLISYMGIDFSAKGQRMYRLLDCTLTYMDEMPKEGDTLRYEIYIDSFARQGETLLFFFRYDCFVEDRLILKMTGGCAGFFTIDELDKGKGVLRSEKERQDRAKVLKQSFQPLLSCDKNTFNRQQLIDIVKGEVANCFGAQYATLGSNPSLRFSAEQILMHDRIISVNIKGGLWGLGEVVSEKDLTPDDWFFA
ncbi:MAG: hypothetical protein HOD92_01065, partial [Deltaproteobacteria bacterium]|nr:hypothetical protein [Deltaproteobacteria bacterium]